MTGMLTRCLTGAAMFAVAAAAHAQDEVSTGIGAAINALPPIDIFIYADESGSVRSNKEESPARKLAEMIRRVVDQPLFQGADRKVLDQDGRLYLYGFGGTQSGLPSERSCTNTVRDFLSGVDREAFETEAGAQLEKYVTPVTSSKTDPRNYKSTDFTCLFDTIAGNEQIASAQTEGRQGIVLIASDFLHDPYNKSRINDGPFAGDGICDLLETYQSGNLPANLSSRAGALAQNANVTEEGRFPTRYGLLVVNLSDADFSSASQYNTCARPTTAQEGDGSILSNLLSDALDATVFNFTNQNADAFASSLAEDLIGATQPALRVNRASFDFAAGGKVSVSLTNPSPVTSANLSNLLLLDQNSVQVEEVPVNGVTIRPGDNVTPDFPAPSGLANGETYQIAFDYTPNPGVRVRRSIPGPLSVADPDITLSPIPPISLIGRENGVTFQLGVRNGTSTPITVANIVLNSGEALRFQPQEPIPANSTQRPKFFTVSVPATAVDALSAASQVIVAFANGSPGQSELITRERTITTVSPTPVNVPGEAVLTFKTFSDDAPVLNFGRIENPNGKPVTLLGFELRKAAEAQPFTLELVDPIRLDPNASVTLRGLAQSDFSAGGGALQDSSSGFSETSGIRAITREAPASAPVALITDVKSRYDDLTCPSVDNSDSYQWQNPPVGSDSEALRLELRIKLPRQRELDVVTAIEIEGSGGLRSDVVEVGDKSQPRDEDGGFFELKIIEWPTSLEEAKHKARGDLSIKLLTRDNRVFCGEALQINAHNEGQPQALEIVPGSQQPLATGFGLKFRVRHESIGSHQRIKSIGFFKSGTSVGEGQVDGSLFEQFILPNDETELVVELPAGLSQNYLSDRRIALITEHNQTPRPLPIDPNLYAKVNVQNVQWLPDEPTVTLTVDSPVFARVERLQFTTTEGASSTSASLLVDLPRAVEVGPDKGAVPIVARLSNDQVKKDANVLASQSLFLCPIVEGKGSAEGEAGEICENGKTRIDASPGATAKPLVGESAPEISEDQILSISVTNPHPYPIKVSEIFVKTLGDQLAKPYNVKNEMVIAPGDQSVVEASLSNDQFEQMLRRGGGRALTEQDGGETATTPIIALDPPTITLATPKLDIVPEWLKAPAYIWPAQLRALIYPESAPTPPPHPVVSGRIVLERAGGNPLDVYTLRIVPLNDNGRETSSEAVVADLSTAPAARTSESSATYNYAFRLTSGEAAATRFRASVSLTNDLENDSEVSRTSSPPERSWLEQISDRAMYILMGAVVLAGTLLVAGLTRSSAPFSILQAAGPVSPKAIALIYLGLIAVIFMLIVIWPAAMTVLLKSYELVQILLALGLLPTLAMATQFLFSRAGRSLGKSEWNVPLLSGDWVVLGRQLKIGGTALIVMAFAIATYFFIAEISPITVADFCGDPNILYTERSCQ